MEQTPFIVLLFLIPLESFQCTACIFGFLANNFESRLLKVIHKDVKPFLNETVKKICFHVDLCIPKYIWHFQCSVNTRDMVKMTKILEISVLASRYHSSSTWPIYNQWLHSLAQQGSLLPVGQRHHSLLTTSHNPIFMRSSKDLWKWPCIISTSGDVFCVGGH